MRNFFIFLPVLFSMLIMGCNQDNSKGTFPQRQVQSELPITRVVMYRNGIGYIERTGKIKGNIVNLRIRNDQVKDILKSLTVVDRSGGYAVNIALPVEKSRLSRINELPPQVRNSGGIMAIVHAFRGAKCKVSTAEGDYTGRIVGVENLGTSEKPNYRLTILQKGRVLSVHSISKITSLKVVDKTLTLGLEKALDVALNKGTWKPVNLSIHLKGNSTHDLTISYVVEMPIWKPAYRLVVGKEGKKILLQGWSVVDNLSGGDWNNIYLSLTAGTPLAFKYDLYTPLTVGRPDLTPSQYQVGEAPPSAVDSTYTADEEEKKESPKLSGAGGYYSDKKSYKYSRRKYRRKGRYGRRNYRRRPSSKSVPYRRSSGKDLDDLLSSEKTPRYHNKNTFNALKRSYKNLVSGAKVSSLFRYDIAGKITVPDRSSSLVTLINKEVEGEDILYLISEQYNKIPYRAVKYKNTSGYVLERGPVAIYRGGQFVGEAIGGVVEKKAISFVPYARENKVIVHLDTKYENEGEKLLAIWGGQIRFEERRVNKFVYSVENRTGKEFTMYVRRNRRTNWTPQNAKKFIFEKSIYYVPVKIKKGKSKFFIKETTPVIRSYGIYYSKARKLLRLLIKSNGLSPKLAEAINKVLALYEEISQLRSAMSTISGSRRVLREALDDARRNLKVLGKRGNRDLRRKIVKNMSVLSTKLTKLNSKWVKLNMSKGQKERRMYTMFKMISFKKKK